MPKVLTKKEKQEVLELGEFFFQVPEAKREWVKGYLEGTVEASEEFASRPAPTPDEKRAG